MNRAGHLLHLSGPQFPRLYHKIMWRNRLVLPNSNLLGPTCNIIYLIQSYDRITRDKKKKNRAWLLRKEDCSLFAFQILVVFIKLIFLKAGTCFSSLLFHPCWLQVFAIASCPTQVLSSLISLTILPDSFIASDQLL